MTDHRDSSAHESRWNPRWNPVWLAALFVTSFQGYRWLAGLDAMNGWGPVTEFLGCMGMLFILCAAAYVLLRRSVHSRVTRVIVLVAALVFRLTLIPAGIPAQNSYIELADSLRKDLRGEAVVYEPFLLFDTDIWRYLWDGWITTSKGTPYGHTPREALSAASAGSSQMLTPTIAEIGRRVQYADLATIYPPGAQWLFALSHAIAPGSIVVWKLLLVAVDMAVILVLERLLGALSLSHALLLLYAWNPLVIKVFSGSGHYDVVLVLVLALLCLALLRKRNLLAGLLLGAGIALKLAPLVLVPFVWRRAGYRGMLATMAMVLVLALPFLLAGVGDPSGMWAFGKSWEFNAGVYTAIKSLLSAAGIVHAATSARAVTALLTAGIVLFLAWKDSGTASDFPRLALLALGTVILLSPVVNPWYVTWLLPLALAAGRIEWVALSLTVLLAFIVMVDGTQRGWALALQHGAFLSILALAHWNREQLNISKGNC